MQLVVHLPLSRDHVVSEQHDPPNLPTNGSICDCHYTGGRNQYQCQHINLVKAPKPFIIPIWDTPEGFESLADQHMYLKQKLNSINLPYILNLD